MPSRPRTSRERFADFLKKFRSGYFSGDQPESDGTPPEVEKADDEKNAAERKQKRRSYIRQYSRELWPHWRMVALLVVLGLAALVLHPNEQLADDSRSRLPALQSLRFEPTDDGGYRIAAVPGRYEPDLGTE